MQYRKYTAIALDKHVYRNKSGLDALLRQPIALKSGPFARNGSLGGHNYQYLIIEYPMIKTAGPMVT